MTSTFPIDVHNVDDAKLIRFHQRSLFDDETVNEVAKQITAILPDPGSSIHLVLDFSDVDLISSSLLSKLIQLQRRVDASHGTLRLCGMSNDIRAVFGRTKLDRLFQIDSQMPTALASF